MVTYLFAGIGTVRSPGPRLLDEQLCRYITLPHLDKAPTKYMVHWYFLFNSVEFSMYL